MADDKKTTADPKAPTSYETPDGVFEGTPPIYFPFTKGFEPEKPCPIGGVILGKGDIVYNENRRTSKVICRNTGDRPIQIASHFHFFEVNRYMQFDRAKAFGKHLNIPATTAVRFEPGEEKEVELVEYGGKRRVIGFNNLTDGYAGLEDTPTYYPTEIRAKRRRKMLAFKTTTPEDAEAEATENEIKSKKG